MDSRILVVIAGPTASGKSELAVEIAEHFQTEIISADSRQCYRELFIGTAKPDATLLERIPHHFINSHSIHSPLHAGDFAAQGRMILDRIFSDRKVAVIVGGTGLYIDALIQGMDRFPTIEAHVREEANRMIREGGTEAACEFLAEKDPDHLKNVDQANPARLRRALEVILQSGLPYSGFLNKERSSPDFSTLLFVPEFERAELYERINARVDRMMEAGLLDEVIRLAPFRDHQALQTVGYSELFDYLDKKTDLQTAVSLIKQHTRNYAKRQLTWFRNKGNFRFIPQADAREIIIREAEDILQ
jgi:tRNA dimethylallyltransferase